jgi:hypothetical protein
MGRACSPHGKEKKNNAYRVFVGEAGRKKTTRKT